jgi:hypothetical protein
MLENFAFDLKALRARDEINDALGVMQNQRMDMPGVNYQPQPQGPTPSMNMQADQRMQTANVNMPMGGGVSANAQFGGGQNMPYGMQNVGVNYNAPSGFGAGLSYSPQQKAVGANLRVPFRKGGLAMAEGGGAWTRKEGQNPKGGLNAVGRASLKAQGQDIKPPVSAKQAKKSPKAAARRKSFCARSAGQAKMFPNAARDPESRLNKARRKWDC